MEGVSHEACSLAGRLSLSKLIVFYDDNDISIDGHVQPWFADDTPQRFEAYGWRVVPTATATTPIRSRRRFALPRPQTGRPTLICCKTMIGFGSPNKGGTHDVHGAPLGAAEIANTRRQLEWPFAPFEVPADVRAAGMHAPRVSAAENDWNASFEPIATRLSRAGCRVRAPDARRVCLPTGSRRWPRCSTSGRGSDRRRRHTQGFAECHRDPGPRACPSCSVARPT
jgi:transketolase